MRPCWVYDVKDLEQIKKYNAYPRGGWGITFFEENKKPSRLSLESRFIFIRARLWR